MQHDPREITYSLHRGLAETDTAARDLFGVTRSCRHSPPESGSDRAKSRNSARQLALVTDLRSGGSVEISCGWLRIEDVTSPLP